MNEKCQLCRKDNQGQVLRLNLCAKDSTYFAIEGPVCTGCAQDVATKIVAKIRWELHDLASEKHRVVSSGFLVEDLP